jgi:hypothetical protein
MCGGSKNGTPSTHPLRGDELRALRRLERGARHHRLSSSPFRAFLARRLKASDYFVQV